jgi:hypothetical protein
VKRVMVRYTVKPERAAENVELVRTVYDKRHGAQAAEGFDMRRRLRSQQHGFQIGAALGVAIVTTVAVSRTDEYLAANAGASPLVALTEGFQSAFLAVAILAGIGVALSLLLLGRPRDVPQEQLEVEPAPGARGGLVVWSTRPVSALR